jgi:hypothetical protein
MKPLTIKYHGIALLCAVSLLTACTTPASLIATSNEQHDARNAAELKGQLGEAELACVQALRAAEQAGASAEISQRQYNLGRIKRLQGKNAEAEALYRQALATEEAAQPRSDARRTAPGGTGLGTVGAGQMARGQRLPERALPLLPKLSPAARGYAAQVLQQYAKQLQGGPQAALGQRFAAVAAGLQ